MYEINFLHIFTDSLETKKNNEHRKEETGIKQKLNKEAQTKKQQSKKQQTKKRNKEGRKE